jgi:hypothetical protein
MNNFFSILQVLTTIDSRRFIYRDEFTGCKPGIFEETNAFRLILINFKTACDNLQKCADDLNTNKELCLQNFKTDQEKFCDTYTSFN